MALFKNKGYGYLLTTLAENWAIFYFNIWSHW